MGVGGLEMSKITIESLFAPGRYASGGASTRLGSRRAAMFPSTMGSRAPDTIAGPSAMKPATVGDVTRLPEAPIKTMIRLFVICDDVTI